MRIRIKQPDNSLPQFDVDGADGVGGAQYMNSGKGTKIKDNAQFKNSGVIYALHSITAGAELLMDYGEDTTGTYTGRRRRTRERKEHDMILTCPTQLRAAQHRRVHAHLDTHPPGRRLRAGHPRSRILPHYILSSWPAKRGGRACRTRTPPLATVAPTEGVRATAFERSWSAFVATRGWLDGNIVILLRCKFFGGGWRRCTT